MTGPASITVLVPTRNRAAALRQTLLAMGRQTASYDEMIVGDDASSDDSARKTVEDSGDSRIRYIRHPRNLGIYQNWNDLIGRASGDYLCIYHDHDWYLPTILEKSRRILDEHPSVAFVHTGVIFVDAADTVVDADIRPFSPVMHGTELRRMLACDWHSPIMAATVMVRREAYDAVGPYQPDRYGLGCDKHMWFRLAQVGDVGYVAEPQALIRARERGRGTARFSWSDEWGALQMRVEETGEAFAEDRAAWREAMRILDRETRSLYLRLAIRSLLLDPPEVWAQEEEKVISRIGSPARLFYGAVKRLRPVQKILAGVGLPLHYARIARRERIARQRAQAMATQPPIQLPAGITLRNVGYGNE